MVDFQSRESRRRNEDEPEEDDPSEPDEEPPEESVTDETEERATEGAGEELSYAVVTVVARRSITEDTQGDTVVEILENAGATVTTRDLIQPSYDGVQSSITNLTKRDDVDVIVTIGGTGVEPSDVTVEALEPLLDKRLPGFGELFRRLSYDEHGTGSVGTRTTAGVVDDTPVFAVPGTIDGAVLATEDIIVAEAESLVEDARKPAE